MFANLYKPSKLTVSNPYLTQSYLLSFPPVPENYFLSKSENLGVNCVWSYITVCLKPEVNHIISLRQSLYYQIERPEGKRWLTGLTS